MPTKTFTTAFMATGLVCPAGMKKIEYGVDGDPGLFVECRASEKAVPTWYLRLKNEKGTNIYKKLGTIKDLSLTQAQKLAKVLRAEHASAAKQAGAAAAAPAEMTLEAFVRDHVNPHNAMRKRSHGRDLQLYHRIGPKFGHLKLTEIRRREVQVFHNELVQIDKLAPASADHHIVYLKRILNLAQQWEFLEKNVLAKVPLMKVDNKVERYLSAEETQRLVAVLTTDLAYGASYVLLFLLSTGARLNEALQAKWEQVDLQNAIWRIPASNSKSKKSRAVPLNDSAMWVLSQLWTKGKHDYLFVNEATNKPWVTLTRAWYRLRTKAGIENLRVHDLRHSFASFLANAGQSLLLIQQLLGHADPRTTLRYAHLSGEKLKEAANEASVIVKPSGSKAA